jgi:hypothetical protein
MANVNKQAKKAEAPASNPSADKQNAKKGKK